MRDYDRIILYPHTVTKSWYVSMVIADDGDAYDGDELSLNEFVQPYDRDARSHCSPDRRPVSKHRGGRKVNQA
jgi:hypothetical protein